MLLANKFTHKLNDHKFDTLESQTIDISKRENVKYLKHYFEKKFKTEQDLIIIKKMMQQISYFKEMTQNMPNRLFEKLIKAIKIAIATP